MFPAFSTLLFALLFCSLHSVLNEFPCILLAGHYNWKFTLRATCSVLYVFNACCRWVCFFRVCVSACSHPQTVGFPFGGLASNLNVNNWVLSNWENQCVNVGEIWSSRPRGMWNTSISLVLSRVILNHKFVLGSEKQVESLISLSTLLKCKAPRLCSFWNPRFLILPGTITAFLFILSTLQGASDAAMPDVSNAIRTYCIQSDAICVCRWLPGRHYSLPLPCLQITVPPIQASSRWSWDPEEERKRQEKWQKEQQRVLQVTNGKCCVQR